MINFVFVTLHHVCSDDETSVEHIETVPLKDGEAADKLRDKLNEMYAELHDGDDEYRVVSYQPELKVAPEYLVDRAQELLDERDVFDESDEDDPTDD